MTEKNNNRMRDGDTDRMQRIYVCSPLRPKSHDPDEAGRELEANLKRAKRACRLVSDLGAVPIAPHLYCTQFLDDGIPEERERGMRIGRELLRGCDELWTFSEYISEGMAEEIGIASRRGIPVRMVCESEGLLGKLRETGGVSGRRGS